jgi:predicted XRE-type DNA-binding protein
VSAAFTLRWPILWCGVPKTEHRPVLHDHEAFLDRARRRKGFTEAYEELESEYRLLRELLTARARAGLTQEQVAASMGTTKSAVSRLEGGGTHSLSVSTLMQYAEAVGCELDIRLVPIACESQAVESTEH